jgi:hypothetical protein
MKVAKNNMENDSRWNFEIQMWKHILHPLQTKTKANNK